MRRINIILLCVTICFGAIVFFFVCQYTYKSKKSEVKQKARQAFVEAFDQELKSRDVKGDFTFTYDVTTIVSVDIPDSVYLESESGKHWYRVDPEKHRMNITNNSHVRSLHSFVFSKSPIDPDSLNCIWKEHLRKLGTSIEPGLCVSVMDPINKVKSKKTLRSEWCNEENLIFDIYIGYACEIEIRGYLHYSLWSIMYMEILLYLVFGIVLVYGCYRIGIVVLDKIQSIYQKKIVEVPIVEIVQGISSTPVRSYVLYENIIFYAEQQKIEVNGVKKDIQLQSSQLLELFLKAEDYILDDDVVLKSLWSNNSGTMTRLHKSITRLRSVLCEIDPSIYIRRCGDAYQLIL